MVPIELTAVFDIRLAISVDFIEFEKMLNKWCKEAGENVFYTFEKKDEKSPPTKLDDTNPFWLAFKKTTDQLNLNLEIGIFPGGTDSRYIRDVSFNHSSYHFLFIVLVMRFSDGYSRHWILSDEQYQNTSSRPRRIP